MTALTLFLEASSFSHGEVLDSSKESAVSTKLLGGLGLVVHDLRERMHSRIKWVQSTCAYNSHYMSSRALVLPPPDS